MLNLIDAEVNEAAHWLTVPAASVQVYGKKNARPGRKMGPVTWVFRARIDGGSRDGLTGARYSPSHMRKEPSSWPFCAV